MNLELAGGAHIHVGSVSENGPVLFPFVATLGDDLTNGIFKPAGNTFSVTPEDVQLLFNEGLYVNMHSLDNVPGEVRGQLLPLTCRDVAPTSDCPGVPDGGMVQVAGGGDSFAQCAGQIMFDVEHTTTATDLSYWYIITDADNNILGFANSAETNSLDLSSAPPGTCRVWGWSYRGLPDPVIGDPLSTLMDDGCEDISDGFITVYREVPDGGEVTLLDGSTEYTGTAGDIVFQVQHTTTAPNISYWYIITDADNNLSLIHI